MPAVVSRSKATDSKECLFLSLINKASDSAMQIKLSIRKVVGCQTKGDYLRKGMSSHNRFSVKRISGWTLLIADANDIRYKETKIQRYKVPRQAVKSAY